MAGFEDLFSDPMAAIGFGLLTSRENPLGAGVQMLQQGSEAKRNRERQEKTDKLAELEMAYKMKQLSQPDLQFNPVTGEMNDMRTGAVWNPAAMQQSGGTMTGSPAGVGQSPQGGGAPFEVPPAPAGLNPREQMDYRKKFINTQFDILKEQEKNKPNPERAAILKEDTKRVLDRLINNRSGLESAVGVYDSQTPTFFQSTADAEEDLGQLRALMTVENLGLLKGVLSDTDIKLLGDIGAGDFTPRRGDQQVMGALTRLRTVLDGGNADPNQAAAIQGGGYKAPAAGVVDYQEYFK